MTMNDTSTQGWLRPSEQSFYRRATDLTAWVRREMNWKLTDFLSPREFQIVESVARRDGCLAVGYGGAAVSERLRAYVMPDDWQPQTEDFNITLLQAQTLEGELSHGAVLGSILGTGIDRRKIGDIEVREQSAIVAVCQDIVPFLQTHWVQAGRHAISLTVTSDDAFVGPQYDDELVSLASLRVDALIGACCHWSRTKAKEAVERGDVSLNFTEVSNADEPVGTGDIVSVRHFGRIRIHETIGESKKGRLRIKVGIVKSNH